MVRLEIGLFVLISPLKYLPSVAFFLQQPHQTSRRILKSGDVAVKREKCVVGSTSSGSDEKTSLHDLWGTTPNVSLFEGAKFVLPGPNPILEIPNFLSPDECEQIQNWALNQILCGTAEECDDYLNYRVNKEVSTDGASEEGKALIEDQQLCEDALKEDDGGGFRLRLDPVFVEEMLGERLLKLLGFDNKREMVFEEGIWVKPTPRTLLIRDQTVVRYKEGDGVPPHVDGKDGTLLIYLADLTPGVSGGRTVFSEDDFAQKPQLGSALLYRSQTELLHYSEAIRGDGEKWIMQLLLDFKHDYKKGDMVTDFRTGQSYVWDGN